MTRMQFISSTFVRRFALKVLNNCSIHKSGEMTLVKNTLRAGVALLVLPLVVASDSNENPFSDVRLSMYAMEDYYKCEDQQGAYCQAEILLKPNDQNSPIARQIKESHESKYRFNRSSLIRIMCIPKHKTEPLALKKYVTDVIAKELKDYNVTLEVAYYFCSPETKFTLFDYLIMAFLCAYGLFIALATVYDRRRRKDYGYPVSKYDKWLKMFSVLENWDKATAENSNADFQKLKSIQGIRFYNTILVIVCHTKLTLARMFIDNIEDFEKAISNPLFYNSLHSDLFIIQIYFMVSSLLLTNQILELHKKFGYFSLGHCFNLFLNRLFRFLPTMVLLIAPSFALTKLMPKGLTRIDLLEMIRIGCKENWLATVLQMNYFYNFKDMCIPGTWYLSVDTLLYLTIIIILYVQLKFKLNLKKLLFVVFAVLSLNFGYIIYSKDLDIMLRVSAESCRRLFECPLFQTIYLHPTTSWSTCCIGAAFGAIFFHTKNKKYRFNATIQILWLLTFLLLPIFVVVASLYNYHGVQRAFVGPLLKPIFSTAFGIGILGMSQGYGGLIKKILEANFAVKMSNFTFSTYVFHFFPVFFKEMSGSLQHFESHQIVCHIVQDVTISFVLGIIATICIEQPGLRLQKMYIPQIKKSEGEKTQHNVTKTE